MAGKRSRVRYRCNTGRRAKSHFGFTVTAVRHLKGNVLCSKCRSDDVVYDEARYRREQGKRAHLRCDLFNCQRVPHPHRRGSHPLCSAYKHAQPMTPEREEELQELEVKLWTQYPRRLATA